MRISIVAIITLKHTIPLILITRWNGVHAIVVPINGRNAFFKCFRPFPIAHYLRHSSSDATGNSPVLTIIQWTQVVKWLSLIPFDTAKKRRDSIERAVCSLHCGIDILHCLFLTILHGFNCIRVSVKEIAQLCRNAVFVEMSFVAIANYGRQLPVSTDNNETIIIGEVEYVVRTCIAFLLLFDVLLSLGRIGSLIFQRQVHYFGFLRCNGHCFVVTPLLGA